MSNRLCSRAVPKFRMERLPENAVVPLLAARRLVGRTGRNVAMARSAVVVGGDTRPQTVWELRRARWSARQAERIYRRFCAELAGRHPETVLRAETVTPGARVFDVTDISALAYAAAKAEGALVPSEFFYDHGPQPMLNPDTKGAPFRPIDPGEADVLFREEQARLRGKPTIAREQWFDGDVEAPIPASGGKTEMAATNPARIAADEAIPEEAVRALLKDTLPCPMCGTRITLALPADADRPHDRMWECKHCDCFFGRAAAHVGKDGKRVGGYTWLHTGEEVRALVSAANRRAAE